MDAGVLTGIRLLAAHPDVCSDATAVCAIRALYSLSCVRDHLLPLVEAEVVRAASTFLGQVWCIPTRSCRLTWSDTGHAAVG